MNGKLFADPNGTTIVVAHGGKAVNTSHSVAADATVTLDGASAKLADLKAGDSLSYTGDPVTNIAATRP